MCTSKEHFFQVGIFLFTLISNDLSNAFWTDIWGGFRTNFFKLITTTLVLCVSDMLRSWWFQGIDKKDRQIS